MNRECNGHHFNIADQSFYRCLLDGKVSFNDLGFNCSNCGRKKRGSEATVVLVRIKLGSIGNADILPS